jgi:hypothetical protein
MRAKTLPTPRVRRLLSASVIASILALVTLGGGAFAANSRAFTVTVTNPTDVSQGGATRFDVNVNSQDNQTIANVKLLVPAAGGTWPANVTIEAVFGLNASMCPTVTTTSVSCDFGNIAALGSRSISILARVSTAVPIGNSITFSASAETNNENGSNRQIVAGTSGPLKVLAANANSVVTANLTGPVQTDSLGTTGAGNLQTRLNLLQDNGGKGNVIAITEGVNATQPTVCVTLKLTCQPDFADLTVNGGNAVQPYLETVLTAKVPKTYSLKKAFVIHVLTDGQIDGGVALFNSPTTSCSANPAPLPCADFTLTKAGILTITVHTAGNGGMRY